MFIRYVHGVNGGVNLNEGKSPILMVSITDQPDVFTEEAALTASNGTGNSSGGVAWAAILIPIFLIIFITAFIMLGRFWLDRRKRIKEQAE
jgi:hypothetical protein